MEPGALGCEALEGWEGKEGAQGRELFQETAGARQAVGVRNLKMSRAISTRHKWSWKILCLLHNFQKADSALYPP